ncbi:hypothetical protein [Persephonella sp.]
MRWYEWLVVVVLIIFGSLTSYYKAFKEINRPVYVVDLTKLVDEKFTKQSVKDVYNQKITPEEYLEQRKKYLDKLQKILNDFDRPVFIKQAVVGGDVIDITDQVKKYLQ